MDRSCWGKCGPDGKRHPLVDHCLDVALVFRALLDIENVARLKTYDYTTVVEGLEQLRAAIKARRETLERNG